MNSERHKTLGNVTDQILDDLNYTAPEDTESKKLKILRGVNKVDAPLRKIQRIMSGHEWDSQTMNEIALVMVQAGFSIKEPKE